MAIGGLTGYSFQTLVYAYLTLKMDLERTITSIDAEVMNGNDMDDVEVMSSSVLYSIQVKNISGLDLSQITIDGDDVVIKGRKHRLSSTSENVIVAHNIKIMPDHKIMGLDSVCVGMVHIISLSENDCLELINRYLDQKRAAQILVMADNKIIEKRFHMTLDSLPNLDEFSTVLTQKTVDIERNLDEIKSGIFCILGKPGSGKSHLADTINNREKGSFLYRFWIFPQDPDLRKRRMFDNFIDDITKKVTGSPEKISEDLLAEKLNSSSSILILDGLDHVYNYNKDELDRFIHFIEKIRSSRVIVLSRPFACFPWESTVLKDWSFEDTSHYLEVGHGISEKQVAENIFRISDGYPLVAFYLASQYRNNGTLPEIGKIDEINEYYQNLISDVDFPMFSPFIVLSPFFSVDDLWWLVDDSYYRDFILRFVERYPFLFERKLNRIALFHDSLTSFLANNASRNRDFEKKIIDKVGASVLSGNDRFLSRFGFIVSDRSIVEKVLVKYSSFQQFEKLLASTEDAESIVEFYSALKLKLDNYPDLFDIGEYYSFVLITQIIERNLSFEFDILYYHLLHFIRNGKKECDIHSNGIMWSTFQIIIKGDYRDYVEQLRSNYYDTSHTISEQEFFIKWQDVEMSCPNNQHMLKNQWRELEYDYASRYFVTKYLSDDDTDEMKKAVSDLLKNTPGSKKRINAMSRNLGIGEHSSHFVADHIIDRLKFMGKERQNNPYLEGIDFIIDQFGCKGSFELREKLVKSLRLSYYEDRICDTSSLWKYYFLYYNRKDYTAIMLPEALEVFERHNLITMQDSIKVIGHILDQSEKGIRGILSRFINKKGIEAAEYCLELGIFQSANYVRFDMLDSTIVDLLPVDIVIDRIMEVMRYGSYSHKVNFEDVDNFIETRYLDLLCFTLGNTEVLGVAFSIDKVPLKYEKCFDGLTVEIDKSSPKIRGLLEDGVIHDEDMEKIRASGMDFIELSHYLDGNYFCFPDPQYYSHYDKEIIRENINKIIHTSMFAKTKYGSQGHWYYYLGNLPLFIEMFSNDKADWNTLYEIFKSFMMISGAWNISDNF